MQVAHWQLLLAVALLGCGAKRSGAPTPEDAKTRSDAATAGDGGLRLPLTSSDQLASVPYGTPPGQLVYDLGTRASISPHHLHIDEDGVYWAARGPLWIYRGALDGSAAPEELGRCFALCGDHLGSDDAFVYWLDGTVVIRRSKQSATEERMELPWDHSGGDLLVADRHAYVAMPGCAAITRIDTKTLSQETTESPVPRAVGNTMLALGDDGALYCASWHRIVRVSAWPVATTLYDAGNSLAGVQLSSTHLYWLDNAPARSFARIGRMPLSGGAVEHFRLPIEGDVSTPVLHRSTNQLFLFKGNWIAKLELDSARFSYLALDYVTSLSLWQEKMYWTVYDVWDEERGSAWGAIRSLPIKTDPVFSFGAQAWSEQTEP